MNTDEAVTLLAEPRVELTQLDRAIIASLIRRQAADLAAIEKALTSGYAESHVGWMGPDHDKPWRVVIEGKTEREGRGDSLADACRAATGEKA